MSFDRLQEKIDALQNPTVVGFDPSLEHIPPQILEHHIAEKELPLEAAAAAVFEWGIGLIEAIYDIVPAIKPQMAYYEMLGPEGIMALKMTCDYARTRGMYVILDGKRNDIGTTAEAYSAAYLGTVKIGAEEVRPFEADALTVNAYLGSDGIRPFIDMAIKNDKAIFALVRTSNPSAVELQDRRVRGAGRDSGTFTAPRSGNSTAATSQTISDPSSRFYTVVGDLIEGISRETIGEYGFTRVGAVVGATYPEETAFLRARLKNTFFLVPGYGAQGGTAADVAHAFDEHKRGAIVNSSRAIIAAWKKDGANYIDAARAAALTMRDELWHALGLRA